jgi:hypothetical protein
MSIGRTRAPIPIWEWHDSVLSLRVKIAINTTNIKLFHRENTKMLVSILKQSR